MSPGKVILRLERVRRKLVSVELGDQEMLLKMSRKIDKLVLEYYAQKHPKS